MSSLTRARVPRLYAIADQNANPGRALGELAEELADLGVRWIQLRAKSLCDRDLYHAIEDTLRRTEPHRVDIWINDRPDLAALFPVRGLHLGRTDLPADAARSIVGDRTWIGSSTHSREQAIEADRDPAVDLIAVGPVFGTSSKATDDPVVGIELVAAVRAASTKPLVAIGGIDATTAATVLEAGADSVAVISALAAGGSYEAAVGALQRAVR